MAEIVVYAAQESPRLRYVLDWLFPEVLRLDYRLTTDESAMDEEPYLITYGINSPRGISIPSTGLLWEQDVRPHEPSTGEWDDVPTLYSQPGNYTIPFDFFSAIFFLLSRYEEYYAYIPDKHGRYPHTESLLFRLGVLKRPLVDEWVLAFCKLLEERYNLTVSLQQFRFQPTYDIDIAWSYKNKGVVRTIGALLRDTARLDGRAISRRLSVLAGIDKDPFDCFNWLVETHRSHGMRPIYFILVAQQSTAFDKNNDPSSDSMKMLIRKLSEDGEVAIHPSYFSTANEVFGKEISLLQDLTGKTITSSRQHYIRLSLPETYRALLERGITDDYTMGYGSALGFRAGTGRDFFWFDLKEEKTTNLKVHPFCFMDSTAFYEEKLGAEDAFQHLRQMQSILQSCESQLITVFHNFSLGTDPLWNGWSAEYHKFLQGIK